MKLSAEFFHFHNESGAKIKNFLNFHKTDEKGKRETDYSSRLMLIFHNNSMDALAFRRLS